MPSLGKLYPHPNNQGSTMEPDIVVAQVTLPESNCLKIQMHSKSCASITAILQLGLKSLHSIIEFPSMLAVNLIIS